MFATATTVQRASANATVQRAPSGRAARAMRSNQIALRELAAMGTLQRTCAPGRCADELRVQPKLEVGAADDAFEREADRVAEHVMRAPDAQATVAPAITRLSRKCSECAEHDAADEAPVAVHDVVASPGRPLDAAARAFFEPRFDRDFGRVRIHDDAAAATSARAVGAEAYTVGDHIAFGGSRYAPSSFAGRRLLAHELSHVVQQRYAGRAVQRQTPHGRGRGHGGGHAATCALELCFAPIRRLGLGAVGGVHAIINVTDAHGSAHFEVDPDLHQAEQPAPGWHSHVVTSGGLRRAGTCQTLTATCAQVGAVRAAAAEYENLDVVYNLPPGPNSNSFAEWVLTRSGVGTAGIAAPMGAAGWGWYPAHPAERANPPRVTRRVDQMRCAAPVRPARTFRALVDLVRDAERRLIACGVASPDERVHVLRGIYYGTVWSEDYRTERSPVRSFFFQQYTDSSTPADPRRGCLPCEVFLALSRSQDIRDHGRSVDFGHLLIGLDARRSATARSSTRIVEGVTGLEAVTWVGDLGGGAARLAMDRGAGRRGSTALTYFRGSDYGGSINLEGDVAGYVTAAGPVSTGDAPALAIAPGGNVADALEAYLLPARGATTGWNSRCSTFLQALGGTLSAGGALTNRAALVASVADRIHNFGCSYMANYMRQRSTGTPALCDAAALHLEGAAREVAEVFVAALEHCAAHPGTPLQAHGPAPAASPPASSPSLRCRAACLGLAAARSGGGAVDRARQEGERLLPGAEELLRRGGEEAERLRRELEQLIP